ncbi:MAG TPA: response regulator transcription factor [Thermodesulfobacteriota bacterium]|nr:response regulator transcription factor [Thermodesulfobacteriota bacterium]
MDQGNPASKLRLFIAEDQSIFREALRTLLSAEPSLEVVGEARDGFETIRGVSRTKPDMVLLDLSMPRMNGMDALNEIRRVSKDIRIIVLTAYEDGDHVLDAFRCGAMAYVVKDVAFRELLFAIGEARKGKRYISPVVSREVVQGFLEEREFRSPFEDLTENERRFLDLYTEDPREEDIAQILSIKIKTVKRIRRRVMQKLHVHNVSELMARGREGKQGLAGFEKPPRSHRDPGEAIDSK